MFQQGKKDVRQDFIRAVADEDIAGFDCVVFADGCLELLGVRVGIKLELLPGGGADRFQRTGRRPVGILVGIELHQIGELGLLARHVGRKPFDDIAPEAAHGWLEWQVG